VDSWLVRLPQDQVILGLSPDQGCCVVGQGTLLSLCLSLSRCTGKFSAGSNPALDYM